MVKKCCGKQSCGKQKFFVTAGSTGFDQSFDIVADCSRSFLVGGIAGTQATDFNKKPIPDLKGVADAFVASLDNCGNQKFFVTAGGTSSDAANAVSISEKRVFTTGFINGTNAEDFEGNPIPNLQSGSNIFVAGLGKKCGDQKFFVTSTTTGIAQGILITNNEKCVFVSGRISGTSVNKFNGESVDLFGTSNIFVAGLDNCGNQKFYKTFGGTVPPFGFFFPLGLDITCNRIYNSGTISGSNYTDFNGTPLNLTTVSNVYVAGFDHCGNQKFFKTATSQNTTPFSNILISQTVFCGDVFVIGSVLGPNTAINFNEEVIQLSGSNSDIFVASLDKCGNQKFYVTTSSSTASEFGNAISVNSARVFVTGSIDGNLSPRDFNGDLVKTYGNNDIFVAGLNHCGKQKFYKTAGGIENDTGLKIASNENAVYVSGRFNAQATGTDFRGCLLELDSTKPTTFVAKLDNCGHQEFFLTATNLQPNELFTIDDKVFLTGQLLTGTGTDFKGNVIESYGLPDIFATRIDDLCPTQPLFRSKIPFF